jgi:NitT/TauT family transport system ATP-binding protein
VRPHQFVSLVGPSGCGKSTVLRMVSGLVPASAGSLAVAGREVRGPVADIGMVFQAPVLLPWRTVLANILFCIEMRGGDRGRHRTRALELIKVAGLSGFEDHLPHQLSGGMQQRVSICRALMIKPALLLMDEPFGALDVMTRERMGFELQRLWEIERYSTLFVTHSIAEAASSPGAPSTMASSGLPRPRAARPSRNARQAASLSPPMFL